MGVIFFVLPKFKKQKQEILRVKPVPTKKLLKKTSSIFVPEWSIQLEAVEISLNQPVLSEIKGYDRLIYFGSDEEKIQEFNQMTQSHKNKWLTIVMTNTEKNTEILKNSSSWVKIIEEKINLAKENGFLGVILDLEVSVIPFDRITNDIVDFNKSFYLEAKKQNLGYGFLIYGDKYYRQRPYFMPEIVNNEILIMAYDFHKSRGEPGPNFPLARRIPTKSGEGGPDLYGYDFTTMINDFKKEVPVEKLTVIFGMYGYDWQVDERRLPINQAKAITLADVKKQFLEKCQWKDCVIKRDDLSAEMEINYVKSQVVNEFGYLDYHIIWYEDEQSVRMKKSLLEKEEIGSTGYWAWGYF